MGDWYGIIEKRVQEFYEAPESIRDFVLHLKTKWEGYKYVCIWGIGNLGRPTAAALQEHNLKVDFYCDNDRQKWGKEYDGIRCLSIEELEKIKEETLIIICARAYKEIFKQLSELGYPHLDRVFMNKFAIREYLKELGKDTLLSKIKKVLELCGDERSKKIFCQIISEWLNNESGDLSDICTNDQYFCEDILQLNDNEVFADCGAYNGDTLREFFKVKGYQFNKMILFELSRNNFQALERYMEQLDEDVKGKIEVYNKGVSDRIAEIWYEELDEGSSEENVGNVKGFLTTIDETCRDKKVSYIKMDIEGSELAALRGARQCILENKPKLAVCLYHKPQDMWEIPLMIKEMLPEYKIYIRHHTDLLNETVCYAV